MKKNRYIEATKGTLLLLAVIHFVILIYLTFTTQNTTYLNVFSVLDLQIFFPGIEMGVLSAFISFLLILMVFLYYCKKSKS